MYYIFRSMPVQWNGEQLYAHVELGQPDTMEIAGSWWNCEALQQPFPHLRFCVNTEGIHPDNYITGGIFDLYSQRLIGVMAEAEIAYESFPASLVDRESRRVLSETYEVFHLLQNFPAIDLEQSEEGTMGIEKVVLAQDFLDSGLLLAREQSWRNLAFIHKNLKKRLEAAGITGCKYVPVDEYGFSKMWAKMFGRA